MLTGVGHDVIAQNHVGDWGTQFGMLVEQILEERLEPAVARPQEAGGAVSTGQRALQVRRDFAEPGAATGRGAAVRRPHTLAIWEQLIDISFAGFNAAYARLGVLLTDADLAGSHYNDDLASVVEDLVASGTAVIDDGALVVFVEGFNAPMIVRKSDGGFGYGATDLAAVRHRVRTLQADRLIYVVGAPQSFHFDLVFAVSRKAGFLPDDVSAEHVAFGQVLGPTETSSPLARARRHV